MKMERLRAPQFAHLTAELLRNDKGPMSAGIGTRSVGNFVAAEERGSAMVDSVVFAQLSTQKMDIQCLLYVVSSEEKSHHNGNEEFAVRWWVKLFENNYQSGTWATFFRISRTQFRLGRK